MAIYIASKVPKIRSNGYGDTEEIGSIQLIGIPIADKHRGWR